MELSNKERQRGEGGKLKCLNLRRKSYCVLQCVANSGEGKKGQSLFLPNLLMATCQINTDS